MALAELQAAMARLFVDPVLRDRFFNDPAVVGAELGLDLEEALGLARTPRRQVDQYADSLHRKRRSQVRRVVPTAARAMRSRYIEHFDRYARESAPRGSKADLDDAAGFVDSIRRRADQVEPAWAVDLAGYELAWRQAMLRGRIPMVRRFRFNVARLAIGQEPEPVSPRKTWVLWWRPTRRGALRHLVISSPRLRPWR